MSSGRARLAANEVRGPVCVCVGTGLGAGVL